MLPTNANRTVIIAAVDRTPTSDAALTTAAGLAQTIAGAELHVLHVVAPIESPVLPDIPAPSKLLEEARKFVDGLASVAAQRFTGRMVAHLAVGEPSREILQLASDLEADVIVVGAHHKNPVERMLTGSVSQRVVKKAECAVVVARPKQYTHDGVPEIEPPCPRCLETQRASKGARLWCDEHTRPHAHGRLHYEMPRGYGAGAMFIRPET